MPRKPAKAERPTKGLTLLGNSEVHFPEEPSVKTLETFPNLHPQREYTIRLACDDFTSLCPITSQPDFARLEIEYIPGKRCLETKSVKFYLAAYRNTKAFNEAVTNRILDDLVAACRPVYMSVRADFAKRGGIGLSVDATYPG